MTNYDAITNQFSAALSDLARRMYAVIFEATSGAGHSMYIAAWDINDTVKMAIHDPLFIDAIRELEHAGLIEYPQILMRYQLTPRAWRAHLLAERAEKGRANEQAPAKPPSSLGNCGNCGIELDNVTTGMVVVHRANRHITVCGPCADSLVARKLYTIVARAKSLSDDEPPSAAERSGW